jgi:hypothetical protein
MSNPVVEFPPEQRRGPAAPALPILPAPPIPPMAPMPVALPPLTARWEPPILGGLAAVFGIVALFKATLFLAPLGLLFALAAALRRQFAWAAIGGIAAVVALATSPMFWGLLGLAWLVGWLI